MDTYGNQSGYTCPQETIAIRHGINHVRCVEAKRCGGNSGTIRGYVVTVEHGIRSAKGTTKCGIQTAMVIARFRWWVDMPLYDFRCMICGYVNNDVLHVADLGMCPKCRSRSWTKVPPAPAGFRGLPTEKFHKRGEE